MAEDLGRRLLAEVREERLDGLVHLIQDHSDVHKEYLGLEPLDSLVRAALNIQSWASRDEHSFPVVELISSKPGAGKTHLLYYLCAVAVLPKGHGGKEACVVILDTDDAFSVSRLAAQLILTIRERHKHLSEPSFNDTIHTALGHVHLFRPVTLASAIATLDTLTNYLFDGSRHHSFHRPVAFIAIDSASAFYWQDRAEREDAAFVASLSESTSKSNTQAYGYTELATSITGACRALKCPSLITNWDVGLTTSVDEHDSSAHAIRPLTHGPWSRMITLRLVMQRMPMPKLSPGTFVAGAIHEAYERRQVVEEGRFECRVNEWGLTAGILQELQSAGAGFDFTITHEGMQVSS